jgi:sugar phosphate isomerase/epimerase
MPLPHHLKPGIKVGPSPEAIHNLMASQAKFTELWYRVDQESRYAELFEYINAHEIQAGLHFWGLLDGNLQPNLAYPDKKIWQQSFRLMQQNIDVAAKHQCNYVNIHLGNTGLDILNLDEHWSKHVPDSEVELQRAEETAEKNIVALHDYAKAKGVRLIVETIPPREAKNWTDPDARLHTHNAYSLSNTFLERLGRDHGININNDLSHTATECITNDRAELWQYLQARTKALLPSTVLIHCNTMLPPFNGTDSHNGILAEDFASEVFPTRDQLRELFALLATQSHDIWLIGEPRAHHSKNYRALCDLLAEL